MDTLSRKHRLRQQQLSKNHLQTVSSNKENRHYSSLESYRINCSTLTRSSNNNNHYENDNHEEDNENDEDEDEEEFRVFKVVQVQERGPFNEAPQVYQKSRNNNTIVDSFSNHQQAKYSHSDKRRISKQSFASPSQQQRSSTDSARSTGDSSGFLSCEGSTNGATQDWRSSARGTASSLNGNQSESGGQFVNDLERLMLQVNCSSPADSYLSCVELSSSSSSMCQPYKSHRRSTNNNNDNQNTAADSTLVRTRELEHTMQCRDEFSSFIEGTELELEQKYPNDNSNQQLSPESLTRKAARGPVLIGVHDDLGLRGKTRVARSSFPPTSSGSSESCDEMDAYEHKHPLIVEHELDNPSSSSNSSSCSPSVSSSIEGVSLQDKELVLVEQHEIGHDREPSNTIASTTELSRMLQLHLNRVASLVRLAAGDRSVSMDEAFGRSDEPEICRMDCNEQTKIEFTPLSKPTDQSYRLQHELEIGHLDETSENLLMIERRRASGWPLEANELLPTNIQLNWPTDEQQDDPVLVNLLQPSKRANFESLLTSELIKRLKLDERTTSSASLHSSSKTTNLSSIRRHMSEFLDSYIVFQQELKKNTSFASDWHQNWLFAPKRPNQVTTSEDDPHAINPKRARLLLTESPLVSSHNETFSETNNNDLLKYSTLILNRTKPIRITYATSCDELSEAKLEIEHFYEAQKEQLEELHAQALESSALPDACNLLLNANLDDDDTSDDRRVMNVMPKLSANNSSQPLLISYDSSLATCADCTRFRFTAYGYLFVTNLKRPAICERRRLRTRTTEEKLEKLRQLILDRWKEKLSTIPPVVHCLRPQDQVRFEVTLSNAELINKLPVVQFCAKISGALPIGVRWFRDEKEEVSDLGRILSKNSSAEFSAKIKLKIREPQLDVKDQSYHKDSSQWPIHLHAIHDFEYQNDWSSVFRFKRIQGDILFEIRNAHPDKDYGTSYRCLVENYCSQSECSFTLVRRAQPPPKIVAHRKQMTATSADVNNNNNSNCSSDADFRLKLKTTKMPTIVTKEANSRAILRTWSQRTLRKGPPDTMIANSDNVNNMQNVGSGEIGSSSDIMMKRSSWQQTVGRRSGLVTADEDKFGKDFPYHPENLLKRLEANKFSMCAKLRPTTTATTCNNKPTNDHPQDGIQFTRFNSSLDDDFNNKNLATTSSTNYTDQEDAQEVQMRLKTCQEEDSPSERVERNKTQTEAKQQDQPVVRGELKPTPRIRTKVIAVGYSPPTIESDQDSSRQEISLPTSRSSAHNRQSKFDYEQRQPIETGTTKLNNSDRSRPFKMQANKKATTCSTTLEEEAANSRREKTSSNAPEMKADANNTAASSVIATAKDALVDIKQHKPNVKSLISRFNLA